MKNYLSFKKLILLVTPRLFYSQFCIGMLPSHLIPVKKNIQKTTIKKTISKKKRLSLPKLLILNETHNVPKSETLEAFIPIIQDEVCNILDQSKNEIINVLNNNEILTPHVNKFIENSKKIFCNYQLLKTLINYGKLDFNNNKIPTFEHYLVKMDIQDYSNNIYECEIIDQTIFDVIFLKKIIIDLFSKITPLIKLYLYNNKLIEIPTNISKLKNLRKLDLSNNQITDDTAEEANTLIKQMPNLSYLNLSNTDYPHDEFPKALGHLNKIYDDAIYLTNKEITKNKLIQNIYASKYQIFYILKQNINPLLADTNILYKDKPYLKLENIVDKLINKTLEKIEDPFFIENWSNGYIIIPKNILKQTYENISGDFYIINKKQINELDLVITNHFTNIINDILLKYSD